MLCLFEFMVSKLAAIKSCRRVGLIYRMMSYFLPCLPAKEKQNHQARFHLSSLITDIFIKLSLKKRCYSPL